MRISATNTSANAAAAVVVRHKPHTSTTYVHAPGAHYESGRPCWSMGLLPAHASRTVTVTVRVNRRTTLATLRSRRDGEGQERAHRQAPRGQGARQAGHGEQSRWRCHRLSAAARSSSRRRSSAPSRRRLRTPPRSTAPPRASPGPRTSRTPPPPCTHARTRTPAAPATWARWRPGTAATWPCSSSRRATTHRVAAGSRCSSLTARTSARGGYAPITRASPASTGGSRSTCAHAAPAPTTTATSSARGASSSASRPRPRHVATSPSTSVRQPAGLGARPLRPAPHRPLQRAHQLRRRPGPHRPARPRRRAAQRPARHRRLTRLCPGDQPHDPLVGNPAQCPAHRSRSNNRRLAACEEDPITA